MARKQEGRWTNVSKSVYSLVLSDDVVAAVDRAAYGLGTQPLQSNQSATGGLCFIYYAGKKKEGHL